MIWRPSNRKTKLDICHQQQSIQGSVLAYHDFEHVFFKVTKNTKKHNLEDHKTEARLSLINNMKVVM